MLETFLIFKVFFNLSHRFDSMAAIEFVEGCCYLIVARVLRDCSVETEKITNNAKHLLEG